MANNDLLVKAKEIQRQKLLAQAKAIQKEKLMQANEPKDPSSIYDTGEQLAETGAGMTGKVMNFLKIPQALGYAGGLSRVGLASYGNLPGQNADDVIRALKGNAPTTSEYMERMKIPEGKHLSDVIPAMYNKTGQGLRLQAGGWADPSARGAAGFVGDVATDPLTYASLGGVPAARAGINALKNMGKAGSISAQVLEKVAPLINPATEGLMPAGKSMFKSGFKHLDTISEKFGKEPISELAWRYGMKGTNKQIASQADEVLSKLRGKKDAIISEVEASGIKPDLDRAFAPAEQHASQLEASRNADRLDAAQALRQEIERYQQPLVPSGELGSAKLSDLEGVKQTMYGGLPESAFKGGTKSAKDIGNVGQKAMARGLKEEIENTVGSYNPTLQPEFKNINADMGGLLTTAAGLDKEALKGVNKNFITSVDPIVYGVSKAGEHGGSGWTGLALKKLADLSKTTYGRTNVGRGLYNLGNVPGMDAFLRRPNPWLGLSEDKPKEDEE